LLAVENNLIPADQILEELQSLIEDAKEFNCSKSMFEKYIMPEFKSVVIQVANFQKFV
jgi:hypothetical protein